MAVRWLENARKQKSETKIGGKTNLDSVDDRARTRRAETRRATKP